MVQRIDESWAAKFIDGEKRTSLAKLNDVRSREICPLQAR